jgi:hypothetical protein
MHKPKNQVCTLRLSICTYLLNTMYDKIAPPSYSSLPSNSQFLVGTSVVMFPIMNLAIRSVVNNPPTLSHCVPDFDHYLLSVQGN